ncbi:hypothetical protein [Hymenobacter baengnokdamensis]|uniref:hypothetical protein n=1 Tax=Hymenobacter baengnokdamensis TaxID=2615203 RepID=UPI0012489706|nr:hypothetical protein [Hymenobacter baengnokdamensis]
MALSYTHESDFRQERDFGQKISATFEFIGVHWRPLGRVMLYLVLPLALVQGILTALLQSRMLSSMLATTRYPPERNPLAMQRAMLANMANPLYYFNIAVSLVFISVLVLTIYGYLVHCLRPANAAPTPITVAEVWGVVRRRLVGSVFSLVGLCVVLLLGSIVFFLPGFYLSIALSLFFIVAVVEETGFLATISRCLSLTKGKWWSTFGLIFIMTFLLYLLFIGLGLVFGVLRASLHGALPLSSEPGQFSPVLIVINTLLFTTVTLLLYPPILLVLAFQYFNLVERREGVGLHQLVDQLGQAPPTGPGATTYRPDEEGDY